MRQYKSYFSSISQLVVIVVGLFSVNANARMDDTTIINAVVNIHVNQVRAWDDSYNNSSDSTYAG